MENDAITQGRFVEKIRDRMGHKTQRMMKAIIKEHALSEDKFWKNVYALYSDVDADSKMDMSIEEVQDLSEFIVLVRHYL